MCRCVAAIILSSVVFAQTAQEADIAAAAKSPITLARYVESHKVFDWDALWKALGTRDPVDTYPPCGDLVNNPCSTKIVKVLKPDQVILILRGERNGSNDLYFRYLQATNGGWQFAGEYRAFIVASPSEYEFMRLGGKPFLKITSDVSQIGAGFTVDSEDWFDLTLQNFDPVFSFNSDGSENRWSMGVGRTFHASCTIHQVNGVETADVLLSVHFAGTGLALPVTYLGVYERNVSEEKFTLRRAYSGLDRRTPISTEEFEKLDRLLDTSNEELLSYALPGLRKIAMGSDADARQWLLSILDHAKDTPEKELLLELLAKPSSRRE